MSAPGAVSARVLIDGSKIPARDKWVKAITEFRKNAQFAQYHIKTMGEGALLGYDCGGRCFTPITAPVAVHILNSRYESSEWRNTLKTIVELHSNKLLITLSNSVFTDPSEATVVAAYLIDLVKDQRIDEPAQLQPERVKNLFDELFVGTLDNRTTDQVKELSNQLEEIQLRMPDAKRHMDNIVRNEIQSLTTFHVLDLTQLVDEVARIPIPQMKALGDEFVAVLKKLFVQLKDQTQNDIEKTPPPVALLQTLKNKYAEALKKDYQLLGETVPTFEGQSVKRTHKELVEVRWDSLSKTMPTPTSELKNLKSQYEAVLTKHLNQPNANVSTALAEQQTLRNSLSEKMPAPTPELQALKGQYEEALKKHWNQLNAIEPLVEMKKLRDAYAEALKQHWKQLTEKCPTSIAALKALGNNSADSFSQFWRPFDDTMPEPTRVLEDSKKAFREALKTQCRDLSENKTPAAHPPALMDKYVEALKQHWKEYSETLPLTIEQQKLKDAYGNALEQHMNQLSEKVFAEFSSFCIANAQPLAKLLADPGYRQLRVLSQFFGRFANVYRNSGFYYTTFNERVRHANEIQSKIEKLQKTTLPKFEPIAQMPQELINAFSQLEIVESHR